MRTTGRTIEAPGRTDPAAAAGALGARHVGAAASSLTVVASLIDKRRAVEHDGTYGTDTFEPGADTNSYDAAVDMSHLEQARAGA